ncbi:D-alanyl-D-alanine carboxypeptidase family protein [Kocuria sp. M4R2S49]|uniref:D-alanyl-D-alanine carboxypeptidase family protein n=1 Tax=Kocuria rhizosphaericola TaxID=3376284 RepID=UPI0037B02564
MTQRPYESRVQQHGQETADTVAARPGHSEHRTGLAVGARWAELEPEPWLTLEEYAGLGPGAPAGGSRRP